MTNNGDTRSETPRVELRNRLDYDDYVDGQFLARVAREALGEIRGDNWLTTATSLPAMLGETITAAYYDAAKRSEALMRVDGALVHAILHRESFSVRLAGPDEATVERARLAVRAALPESDPDAKSEAEFTFWWSTDHGVRTLTRSLPVPSWPQVAANYAQATRAGLERLVAADGLDQHGQLILWHGDPGAGKTFAIRALAWEWREWCDFHYVTDPDALFGESPGYLIQMVTGTARDRGGVAGDERWRCLVLEDTGELIGTDAKQREGQALSRLLNVVDGLIGQGFNVVVLVTTNEPLRKLHPAVSRPGRCCAEVEFTRLSASEANSWLEAHGSQASVSHEASLAELFAVLNDRDDGDLEMARRAVGFAVR